MDIIIKQRGHGKTSDLIRMSAQNSVPILALDKMYVKDLAKRMNIKIPEPISYSEYFSNHLREAVYIDELNTLLWRLGIDALACTISIDE